MWTGNESYLHVFINLNALPCQSELLSFTFLLKTDRELAKASFFVFVVKNGQKTVKKVVFCAKN